MKKIVLISGIFLTTLSLMALGVFNVSKSSISNNDKTKVDFFYDVDSRFLTTITKKELHDAHTILDILPKESTQLLQDFEDVTITILGEKEVSQIGSNEVLNPMQKALLKNASYSTNIHITANCISRNNMLGSLRDYDLVYYITVVPEKEAEYTNGHQKLMNYIQSTSIVSSVELKEGRLRPGKIAFTINAQGEIENAVLDVTCGYPSIDDNLLEIINSLPEKWVPATNALGESVEQEYVLSFGKVGC